MGIGVLLVRLDGLLERLRRLVPLVIVEGVDADVVPDDVLLTGVLLQDQAVDGLGLCRIALGVVDIGHGQRSIGVVRVQRDDLLEDLHRLVQLLILLVERRQVHQHLLLVRRVDSLFLEGGDGCGVLRQGAIDGAEVEVDARQLRIQLSCLHERRLCAAQIIFAHQRLAQSVVRIGVCRVRLHGLLVRRRGAGIVAACEELIATLHGIALARCRGGGALHLGGRDPLEPGHLCPVVGLRDHHEVDLAPAFLIATPRALRGHRNGREVGLVLADLQIGLVRTGVPVGVNADVAHRQDQVALELRVDLPAPRIQERIGEFSGLLGLQPAADDALAAAVHRIGLEDDRHLAQRIAVDIGDRPGHAGREAEDRAPGKQEDAHEPQGDGPASVLLSSEDHGGSPCADRAWFRWPPPRRPDWHGS